MNQPKNKSGSNHDFQSFAHHLLNKEVEVITSDGSYTGTLIEVGSDILILQTRVQGRLVRLAIRIALIAALFRLTIGHRGPFWIQGPEEQLESSDFLNNNE